jgi:hypothetical protein
VSAMEYRIRRGHCPFRCVGYLKTYEMFDGIKHLFCTGCGTVVVRPR